MQEFIFLAVNLVIWFENKQWLKRLKKIFKNIYTFFYLFFLLKMRS